MKHVYGVMGVFAVCMMVFFVEVVRADELSWTWDAPITRTDGTAFDMATEGAGYVIWFNDVQETNPDGTPLMLSVGANGLSKVIPSGELCIDIATVDNEGRQGPRYSMVSPNDPNACKTVLAPPGAPTNLTLTVTVGVSP